MKTAPLTQKGTHHPRRFANAAGVGDLTAIRQLVAAGTSSNAVDGCGNTPLLKACHERQDVAALMLLQAGADFTIAAELGVSPSYCAALSCPRALPRTLAYLLAAGADPTAPRCGDGESTLFWSLECLSATPESMLLDPAAQRDRLVKGMQCVRMARAAAAWWRRRHSIAYHDGQPHALSSAERAGESASAAGQHALGGAGEPVGRRRASISCLGLRPRSLAAALWH